MDSDVSGRETADSPRNEEVHKILIYFTNGIGDKSIPRPLTSRTMWVLHDEHCNLSVRNPYGEVLVMD